MHLVGWYTFCNPLLTVTVTLYDSYWDEINVFILGVHLPVNLAEHEIVASEDNKYLYTIGNDYSSNNKDIFKFTCTNSIKNCSWTKILTKLQYGRELTVAMPIPNALANTLCSKECNCTAEGTDFCNKATGECFCNSNYCGEHCQDTGSSCCTYGYYYDDYDKKCKGQLCICIWCFMNLRKFRKIEQKFCHSKFL